MKLNHNCVRDVLLFIEENLHYGQIIDFSIIEIGNYSHEDLLYTSDKLLEAGYLHGIRGHSFGVNIPNVHIDAITWNGHQFLDNIRDDGIWKDTKHILSKFSSVSLSLVSTVASEVITALIQKQIHLQ